MKLLCYTEGIRTSFHTSADVHFVIFQCISLRTPLSYLLKHTHTHTLLHDSRWVKLVMSVLSGPYVPCLPSAPLTTRTHKQIYRRHVFSWGSVRLYEALMETSSLPKTQTWRMFRGLVNTFKGLWKYTTECLEMGRVKNEKNRVSAVFHLLSSVRLWLS